MWSSESGKDPGGPSGAPQELADLRDQFEQQQVLISQLKEMLRKTEQTKTKVSQERVEEMANTLSKMNERVKRSKLKREGERERPEVPGLQIDTPAKEKINLLRQQLEENKAKLAERDKNQKGIEEMVSQMKAQLDDSQNLINQSPLNLSLAEPKAESYSAETSSQELYRILLIKEKRMSDLLSKVQKLEGTVLDLQENIKEKDQVIDARTKAITLMSENLSKKGKHTLDMLDETKEQMRKMQENFIQLESEMKEEKEKLILDLGQKNNEIENLRSINSALEADKLQLEIELKEYKNQSSEIGNYKQQINELNDKIAELEDVSKKSPQKSNKRNKKGDRSKSTPPKEEDNKIAELQKVLDESKHENEQYLNKIAELEKTVEELNAKVSQLELTTKTVEISNESEEISKLKKQIDESNKNMIKVKAQHKSKIKELTKKIEALKSASDPSSEAVRLEVENLNKKVDELQQEKDSLLLKLEQSDSNKDSALIERVNELEQETIRLSEELAYKQKEIEDLKQKSDVSAAEVVSAIDSITFEEQLDKLEADNKMILQEKEEAIRENKTLSEKLEHLKKEKQELMQKLEHYIQENIDLIDKLEKLSAEKVSSAESIEIVESFTQQEKLELEAYQKQMDFIKTSQENLEQNVELNESVNQLTEETSELLQRIELFTVERREVMEKMEMLTQENAQLNLKVKEIENNRDILVETYEQLQNEKEELDKKLHKLEGEEDDLKEKLKVLQEENEHLRENSTSAGEHEFEKEINELRNRLSELNEELMHKNEEISNYESIVEATRAEVISSADTINNLQKNLEKMQQELNSSQNEVTHLNSVINDLNSVINKLENENRSMASNNEAVETLEKQLHDLKQLLKDNIRQTQIYESEINDSSRTIEELKTELNKLNDALLNMEHSLHSKDDEIKRLLKEKTNLQEELKSKNENFHSTFEELKSKCQKMAAQIEHNSGSIENIKKPLEEKIEDLTSKNKEQLEKMKKIAANLKKKSAAYQELEGKYSEVKEKWETENREKEDLRGSLERKDLQIVELNQKINSLVQQLHEVEDELSSVQNHLLQKQKEYDNLTEEFNTFKESCMAESSGDKLKEYVAIQEELQNKLYQYENQISSLVNENEILRSQQHNTLNSEIHSKEQEIVGLKEELWRLQESSLIHSNALQAKIQELEMFIENQDVELTKYKERVNKLEECLNAVEERRLVLEERTQELGAQLEEKSTSLEEISQTEDELEKRINAIVSHEEAVQKRLRDALEENREILEQNRQLTEFNNELRQKLNVAQNKVSDMVEYTEKLSDIENENVQLKEHVQELESHMKLLHADFEQKFNEKKKELEISESDLQEQLSRLYEERKEYLEQIEKLSDQIKEYDDQHLNLNAELSECRQTISDLQRQLEAYQNVELENQNYIAKIEHLNQLLKEQEEYVQQCKSESQSADVSQLKHIISEKDKEIEEYQRQNLQLQMQNTFTQNSQFDLLMTQSNDAQVQLQVALRKLSELQQLEEKYKNELAEKQSTIAALENQLKESTKVNKVPNIPQEPKAVESSQIATFSWPQDAEDPFSFAISTSEAAEAALEQTTNENTVEELQKKIKTLEFMLYNVEKEKDDALLQCHEMSNELTRLVYEREQVQVPKGITSQIVHGEDTVDTSQLHQLEFEQTKAVQKQDVADLQPVVEDIATKKQAYLCFSDDDKQSDPLSSQILTTEDNKETPESQKRLHDLEFEKTKPLVTAESSKPVQEDKLQAKAAYLCYNPRDQDAFGENDDGWVWGPEEAKLEEEHRQQTESSPQNLIVQLQALTEKVKVLELEREHHLEEIRQAQIKSGKLIKKLKELKSKNDQLTSQIAVQSSGFPGLDDAIQDEFKLQIECLERRVKELTGDLSKERQEKENLKKRIDVLTAANERMVEMKERQEVEIISWKQRSRELENKLEQVDWGDDGFDPSKQSRKQESRTVDNSGESVEQLQLKVEELNETVKELSLDNEELQALLEEQRNLRLNAEKSKSNVDSSIETKLLAETESLNKQLLATVEEKKRLQEELNVLIQKNDVLSIELQRLSNAKQKLDELTTEKNEMQNKFESVKSNYDSLVKESIEFNHELLDKLKLAENRDNQLQQKLNTEEARLREDLEKITAKLSEKEGEISTLKDSFNNQLSSLQVELDKQNQTIQELRVENDQLIQQIKEKDSNLLDLHEKHNVAATEFEQKLSRTVEDLAREWAQQVDQRGTDVAESWKLHLESRENEFMQLEQQLRKEIYELEEKCNSLVNENNELRKNVDAEIRNEVDRIAALQQQISDKQAVISELKVGLQEKQNIIEALEMNLTQTRANLAELQAEVQNSELKITDYETTLTIKDEELCRNQDVINQLNDRLKNGVVDREHVEKLEEKVKMLEKEFEESETKLHNLQEDLKEKHNALTQSSVIAEDYKYKLQQLQDNQKLLHQELEVKANVITELQTRLQEAGNEHKNIEELQRQIASLNDLLQEKQNQLDYLNSELPNYQQLIHTHESTISRLNSYIEEVKQQSLRDLECKSQELEHLLNERLQEISVLSKRLTDVTNHYEESLMNKDGEIESLKVQLEEQTKRFNDLMNQNQQFQEELKAQLNQKVNECKDLHAKVDALEKDEERQMTNLHNIIEDQVLKIEELKKELFEKSNDYDSLIAELDMHQHEKAKDTETAAPSVYHETEEDNLLEPVSRAELDLALYMLHQRDVRCEELTMELMQLLEERDTLQLRLSNAIREKEELRSTSAPKTQDSPVKMTTPRGSPTGTVPKSRASAIVLGATGTELATEAEENLGQVGQSDPLAHKLSELRTVGYGKDKTLVDEKELRRLQQLSIMQQHKDIASKLPPEAAARLVDANYTLSRDVQSPSKVLLNWLWGRSTPKVNDV